MKVGDRVRVANPDAVSYLCQGGIGVIVKTHSDENHPIRVHFEDGEEFDCWEDELEELL